MTSLTWRIARVASGSMTPVFARQGWFFVCLLSCLGPSLVPGHWFLVSGPLSLVPTPWSLVAGRLSQVLVPGSLLLGPGPWSLLPGP